MFILLANQVVGVLERAAANQFPQSVVLELIGLGALQYRRCCCRSDCCSGWCWRFGRLYHDSEVAAALACGAGPANFYVPVTLLALLLTAGLAWLTLGLAPACHHTRARAAQRGAARRAVRTDRSRQVPQLRWR